MTEFAVRPVEAREYEQCLALWQSCFTHFTEPMFARFFRAPNASQMLLGGFISGQLVSTTQIVPTGLQGNDGMFSSGYITNVATHPRHRRQGLATRCLERALEVMDAGGLEASHLLALGDGPYEKLGWQAMPMPILQGDIPPYPQMIMPGYQIRQATLSDLPAMIALYTEFNHRRPLAVHRSASYWQQWLLSSQGDYLCPTFVCRAGTQVMGYVQLQKHPGWQHFVAEIAVHDQDLQTLCALFSAIANRIRNQDRATRIRLGVPRDASTVDALEMTLSNVEIWGTLPWMYRSLRGDVIDAALQTPTHPYTWLFDAQ